MAQLAPVATAYAGIGVVVLGLVLGGIVRLAALVGTLDEIDFDNPWQ